MQLMYFTQAYIDFRKGKMLSPKAMTHQRVNKMASILWTIFSSPFSEKKIMQFGFIFHSQVCQILLKLLFGQVMVCHWITGKPSPERTLTPFTDTS